MMTRSAVVIACLLSVVAAGWAVEPASWTHETEKDFSAGELDKTAVTSLGELMLSRALERLIEPQEGLGMISAVAVDGNGRLVVAAAPSSKLYRLEKGKLVEFAQLPGVLVRSLCFAGDDLIAGTVGKGAGIYRIDAGGKVEKVWAEEKVSCVWAVLPGPRGSFYAATGAAGQVYHVSARGKATVIYDSEDKNILSLAVGEGGLLYAGTGENGLIVEIEPARRSGRVLYDAAENEISALVVDADGVLYAATSDSSKASGSGEQPSGEVTGKPERPTPTQPGRPSITTTAKTLYRGPATEEAMEAFERRDYTKLERMWKKAGAEGGDATSAPATRPAGTTAPAATTRAVATTAPTATASAPTQVRPRVPATRAVRPTGPPRPTVPTAAPGKGNAVYRVDTQGFVRAVFRRPVTILAMALQAGELVLATGHGGQIFAVDLDDDRITMLAKVDPKDVMALADDGKGRQYFGTAGKAGVFSLGREYAEKGNCLSSVLDAKQISEWGTLNVHADVPAGSGATIATRSGNVAKPDEKTWSAWSAETPLSSRWAAIASPAGRFLQYRLTLTSKGQVTPVIEQVEMVYQANNLAPVISAVQAVPSHKPAPPRSGEDPGDQPMRYRIVVTKAADPNGDKLQYAIHFRRLGHKRWIKLAEKLTKPAYPWDTLGVGDGTYEFRVTASDARSNPSGSAQTAARISRPLIVDNSPPQVADLVVKPAGKGKVSLAGSVTDAVSRIRKIEYAVDTNDEWAVAAAADGICDSQRESFSATLEDLEAGTHRIAVRVRDEFNNIQYASVEVTVAR